MKTETFIKKQNINSITSHENPVFLIPRTYSKDVITHFKNLSSKDKKMRFGFNISDSGIENYVNKINFEEAECLAYFDENKNIQGVSHLSSTNKAYVSEIGLSVNDLYQGKGIGFSLLIYSVHWAKYKGYDFINIEFLSNNKKIVNWVKRAGFPIQKIGFESLSVFPTIEGPIPSFIL